MHMTSKNIHRGSVLEMVDHKAITLKQASQMTSLSYRHLRRLYKRYKQQGCSGLLHRLQGRTSNRKITINVRNSILSCYKNNCIGYGPTRAAEKLACLGYAISRETLKRWLIEEGIWHQQSGQNKQQLRVNRKINFGETIFLSGHAYRLPGKEDAEKYLLSLVDEATGTALSLLAEKQTIHAAMRLLWMWVEKYGIPMNIWCERKFIYKKNRKPAGIHNMTRITPKTAFYASCNTLGLDIIISPLSKIKEHLPESYRVYIKNLLKHVRSAEITTLQEANTLITNDFRNDNKSSFADNSQAFHDFHVRLRKENNLNEIICFRSKRPVSVKQTVEYKNRFFHITKENPVIPFPNTEVVIKEWLNGSVHILYNKNELNVREITST
jgi:hypothetical protein